MKRRFSWFLALVLIAALIAPTASFANSYDLAYGETPLGSSSKNKIHNIELAASALSGWVVSTGQTFSFNAVVGPRTEANGYLVAENGRSAKVRGGGVAQVATTLYLAVRQLGSVSITEKHTYGKKFSDGYVSDVNDAILTDYNAGTDFCFKNNGDDFEIFLWADDTNVCCTISPVSGGGSYEGGDEDSYTMIAYASTWVGGYDARRSNIELAADAVNGYFIGSGYVFSFNDVVGPRSKEAGYKSAINGRGVKVTGGGVAQLASTIYLAVKDLDFVTVTEKRTYGKSYNQSYVASADDAIVTDYSAGTDFAFRNDGANELVFYTYVDDTGWLVCEVWEGSGDSWMWSE